MSRNINIDVQLLSKKYQIDVNQVIKMWKKNKSDMEVASSMGIELWKLTELRNEMIKDRMQHRAKKLNWT